MKDLPKNRVCYICYRRFPDTNFEHYSKAVSDNGYDVTILAPLEPGQQISEIRDGRKIRRIPLPKRAKKRKSALEFVFNAVEFLNKHQFHIVHIHHTCPYFSLIRILTSQKRNFIYHITSYPISSSTFTAYKEMLKNFIQCLFMDKIIVQSEELREKLIGIRSLKRTVVVPVGFNRTIFYPVSEEKRQRLRESISISKNQPLLVYCGVIGKFRQLHRLIQAFAKVQKVCEHAILMMIGDGAAMSEIKHLVKRLDLENKIIFKGRVPHEKVVNFIAAADIGISYVPINANFTYNPPLKTFEYLACGLPTIATRTESNSKIIKDGFNGVLVSDRSEDLSRSILNLLKDKERMNMLRKNSIKSIMAFDFNCITKKFLIPLYESLLRTN